MRKKSVGNFNNTKILLLDDEIGIIDSLSVILKREGYQTEGITSPLQAISKLQNEHFDILILDFLMSPIHGDKVVEKVREFNKDIYIILLTGHKDMAPPLETIKNLQIQAYCEKSDSFDQLLLLVEAGRKSALQISEISQYQKGLDKIIDFIPKMYEVQTIEKIMEEIISNINGFINVEDAFICVYDSINNKNNIRGIGNYRDGIKSLNTDMLNTLIKIRESKQALITEYGAWYPITNNTDAYGVIYIEFEKTLLNTKLIDAFVKQVTTYLNFALLKSLIQIRDDEVASVCELSESDYKHFISTFNMLLCQSDPNIKGHCERVSYYAVRLGEAFELDQHQLELLRISGLLHDIFLTGGINDIYIDKDDDKYKHVSKVSQTLKNIAIFKEFGNIIETHHERIDGSGYPNGLLGNQIPFLSKILAVVDTFDVLMNTNYSETRLGMDQIKNMLIEGKNTLFDAKIVDNFITLLDDYYLMEEELGHTYR